MSFGKETVDHGQRRHRFLRELRSWLFSFGKSGYDVLRLALGVLLLVTAGLKGYQLATEPTLGTGLLDNRWFLIFVVEFELFFGLWLLSGLLLKLTWTAAVACFTLFTCISLYKALSGHASCGCFGKVEVNPWITGGLDLTAVSALLWWRPKMSYFTKRRAAVALAIWLAVGLPLTYATVSYSPALLTENGFFVGDGNLVILEPYKWIGSRFPLLPYIDDLPNSVKEEQPPLRERLTEGEWLVVLYRHGCPECEKMLDSYKRIAEQGKSGFEQSIKVAIIEIPLAVQEEMPSWCEVGTLKIGYRWFFTNSISIHLRNGVVEMSREDILDAQVTSPRTYPGYIYGKAI
jgi:hypothetical protein